MMEAAIRPLFAIALVYVTVKQRVPLRWAVILGIAVVLLQPRGVLPRVELGRELSTLDGRQSPLPSGGWPQWRLTGRALHTFIPHLRVRSVIGSTTWRRSRVPSSSRRPSSRSRTEHRGATCSSRRCHAFSTLRSRTYGAVQRRVQSDLRAPVAAYDRHFDAIVPAYSGRILEFRLGRGSCGRMCTRCVARCVCRSLSDQYVGIADARSGGIRRNASGRILRPAGRGTGTAVRGVAIACWTIYLLTRVFRPRHRPPVITGCSKREIDHVSSAHRV